MNPGVVLARVFTNCSARIVKWGCPVDLEVKRLLSLASSRISRFIGDAPRLLANPTTATLCEIGAQVRAMQELIEEAGRSVERVPQTERAEAEFAAELRQYAENLEAMKSLLLQVQTLAETNRRSLLARAPALTRALAWSEAVTMTVSR